MNRDLLAERICAEYCRFYSPGKDENLACGGFLILQKLLEMRNEVPAAAAGKMAGQKTEDELSDLICRKCPFYDGDCDYAAWKRDRLAGSERKDVSPCGGFIYLCLALEHGSLDIQMIDRVS